jgi:hypothetical protein
MAVIIWYLSDDSSILILVTPKYHMIIVMTALILILVTLKYHMITAMTALILILVPYDHCHDSY